MMWCHEGPRILEGTPHWVGNQISYCIACVVALSRDRFYREQKSNEHEHV